MGKGAEVTNEHEEIIDTDVSAELSSSFLEYSMSVIVARALPDARDGLKPVHRRILWSMHQQGIRPGTPYKKCARVVGDVIGRYHPHGDSAVYEALVRLAQPWSMRLPLVDGHGNFGSLDDGPAAMRYTECRLDSAAMPLVEELGENTVDMRPNYDGTESEPSVMPASFPNLLVNGSTGIAVGMATNMPPHNLAEVIDGLRALLEDPAMTLEQMRQFIPGPDLPTGGSIVGLDGIAEAYETGRGSFRMRATAEVVTVSARRQGIEVTELPYLVGPEKVIARIKELVTEKKLAGISDVKDFSDRKTGLRLLIEVKTGFNPQAVLAELYRLTPLEEGFGVNNVALVDGQPRTLGLLDLCRVFLEHRREVVRRRTEHRLAKAEARAHVIEGLVIALAAIDEVVALIRSSRDSASARAKLMKTFTLSERQAEAILEMTLRRLTSLEVTKLKDELKELRRLIAEYQRILGSAKALRKVISDELAALSERFGSPRRTRLLAAVPEVGAPSLEVPDEPCTVALGVPGVVARVESGPHRGRVTKNDVLVGQVDTSTHSIVGCVASTGALARLAAVELPSGRPVRASEAFALGSGAAPVALVDCRPGRVIMLVCASGAVKRVRTDDLAKSLETRPVVSLPAGDAVVWACSVERDVSEAGEFALVSSAGQLLRFPASSVAPKGPGAGAMAGMRLPAGVRVVGASFAPPDVRDWVVVTVSDAGAAKVSAWEDFPAKGRGTAGVRAMTFRRGESEVAVAAVGGSELVAFGPSGAPVALPAERSRRDGPGVPGETAVSGLGRRRTGSS